MVAHMRVYESERPLGSGPQPLPKPWRKNRNYTPHTSLDHFSPSAPSTPVNIQHMVLQSLEEDPNVRQVPTYVQQPL